jgi:hypothetical protein
LHDVQKNTGDFCFFCSSCLHAFGMLQWDPNRGKLGYESDGRVWDAESNAIENIRTEINSSKARFAFRVRADSVAEAR